MEGLIPSKEVSMINVAESSGRLADGQRSPKLLVEADEIRSKVTSAMITPVLMFCVILVVIAGYSVEVSHIHILFANSTLAGIMQALYNLGMALVNLWIYIAIFMVSIVVLVMVAAQTVTGDFCKVLIKIHFNHIREIEVLFLPNMSSLLIKGAFNDGLKLLSDSKNRWL